MFLQRLPAIKVVSFGQASITVGLNHMRSRTCLLGFLVFLGLLVTPWIVVGFVCYAPSSIFWMDVLSKLDFSLAFPMVGSVYVFNLLIGRFFFHEMFGWDRMLDVGLILFGICCLVRSGTSG
jgi:multidrug transporter EmrE-like cation transporter